MQTSRSRWCAGNHRGLMLKLQKKLNFLAAILDFWRPSWIYNGYLISLYSICGNKQLFVPILLLFITKWTIVTPIVIFYHFCIMQTRSSYLQIIPLILNHFWPNLVHLYKMYFWTSLVLCVVFKCQYFWSYSRKTHFWPFVYLFISVI